MNPAQITKYEKARIIGTRATHLSGGATPMIDIGDMTCAIEIATCEYKAGKIPLILERVLPNGNKETITLTVKHNDWCED